MAAQIAAHRRRTMPTLATIGRTVQLPPQPTRLLGREDELASLRSLLAEGDVRLLTLTGPGGVGKTRLAVAAAEQVAERFPDGVWFVDLAPLLDPALVVPTIARALGVREVPGQPSLEALCDFVGNRRILLVIDNVEHVLVAVQWLDALLSACPRVTILATSREPLRLRRERVVTVHPLPVPDSDLVDEPPAADALLAVPSVALFVARARAADADFSLSTGNARAVADLSRRLEGLPLAVELAAARIRVLKPEALLARMEHSLMLLRWDAPDLPERHRSLHAALDWSYGLLTPDQQALFRRLAVFAGGFTLDGAEAVFTGAVPGVDDGAGEGLFYRRPEPPAPLPLVLENLAALIDHSLVQRVAPVAGEPRYRMLATVRQFGLEQLNASSEADAIRRRHLTYLVARVEALAERIWLPEGEQVLARLDAKHDDVRAALTWAEASGEAALGLRLARAMLNYWVVRSHLREGRSWLERAISWEETPPSGGGGLGGETPPSPERARAQGGLGWLALLQGEPGRAEELIREGLRVAGAVGARVTEATGWDALGLALLHQGRYAEAMAPLDAALTRFQELEPVLVAGPQYVSHCYSSRGEVALAAGDLDDAAQKLEEAVRWQRAMGFTWGQSETLRYLGDLAVARDDIEGALARYREALSLVAQEHDYPHLVADALDGVAAVAAARGEAERAARLHGAAAGLRERLGTAVASWEQPAHEQRVAAVRAALGDERFAALWASGHAQRLEAVIAEVLDGRAPPDPADGDPAFAPDGDAPAADPAAALGLTPREADVLRLLAQGRSNREIGEALFVSPRTVNFHVTNLLAKLGLDSRAAAAAFAVRHGLA
jgi:predicted ATPase/DNA-binding CsgD family transcriptional regulator